jgi:glycosyltransferase involved in cell wall biosynthesis
MFVRPSCQEGFGIAFLEAMASGLPVIGTKVGGITDIVRNRFNGMLVGNGDVAGLVETIKIVLNDAVLRKRMGNRGLSYVSDKYNWEELSKKLLDIYKGINNL